MVCEEENIDSTVNVASGKSYTLSTYLADTGTHWDTTPPTKLTDGNLSTGYTNSVAWINTDEAIRTQGVVTVDLEAIQTNIARVRVLGNSHMYYRPTKMMIFTSVDGNYWEIGGLATSYDASGWWDVYFRRKRPARYVMAISEKSNHSATYDHHFISEIQVYRARNCEIGYFKTPCVTNLNDSVWGMEIYEDTVYFVRYGSPKTLYKVDLTPSPKVVASSNLSMNGGGVNLHCIPSKNHLIMGSNGGTINVYDMDDLSLIETQAQGNLPIFQGTTKSVEGIAHDDKYVYFLDGYEGKVHIHKIDDYSKHIDPIQIASEVFWHFNTNETVDFVAVGKGDDQWASGKLYFLYKDDWSSELIDDTCGNVMNVALNEDTVAVGGSKLRLYDTEGNQLYTEDVSSRVSNLAIVGNSLIHGTGYAGVTTTSDFYISSLDDMAFHQPIGVSPHISVRGKANDKWFASVSGNATINLVRL